MFGWVNILQRLLFTNFLVFSTYNPSNISYYHWATSIESNKSIVAVVGVMIFAAFVFLIRSTWRSIKLIGILTGIAFFTAFCVMLIDLGVVNRVTPSAIIFMVLMSLAGILTAGLCFSAIRARLSGQIDSDDVGRV